MAKSTIFILLLALFGAEVCHGYISCSRCIPAGPVRHPSDGLECVAVVKMKCNGMSGYTTGQWRRGERVVDNCSRIPSGTAIATFAGPNNSYNGGSFRHAAIFVRCSGGDIVVDDQWVSKGTCSERIIRASGSGSNGAGNFYTISV